MSSSSKSVRPLRPWQFWVLVGGLAACCVLALVAMAAVARHHGACPTYGQSSRPAAASCYAAYGHDSGVVG